MNYPVILEHVTKTFKLKGKQTNLKTKTGKSKLYRTVLDDISFKLSEGEVLGIIGLNGAGKSTLLRLSAGIYKPNKGIVKISGKLTPILRLGMGFHPELSAKENIIVYGLYLGFTKSEIVSRIDHILDFAELQNFSEMSLKHFSTGMRTRLAFSTSIEVNPDILLIDESLSVGDALFKEKSLKAIKSLKKNKKTIIITSHNAKIVQEFCDVVLLIDRGKSLGLGKPDEIIKKYQDLIKTKT